MDEQLEQGITLNELFNILIKKWWIIFGLFLIGLITSSFYTKYFTEDYYIAESSMIVQVTNNVDSEYTNLLTGQRLVDTYSEIAKSNVAISTLKENLDLSISHNEISEMITVSGINETLIVKLSVKSYDNELTALIANELINIVKDLSTHYEGLESVEVLDTAIIPTSPAGPNKMLHLVIGGLLGIITACGIIFLLELFRNRFKTEIDIEKEMNTRVLGSIPFHTNDKLMNHYSLITKDDPHSFEAIQYRKLRTNIDYLSIDKEYDVINVTSTCAEEGKTTTAINLAFAYAHNKHKTLLIDMDLRNPKIHYIFNISNDVGLSNCAESCNNFKQLISTVEENLDVLPAGPKFPYPSELLGSSVIKKLIKQLKGTYNKIIIDCPPCSLFPDTKIISSFTSGTLYIVLTNKTKIDKTKKALAELNMADIDIIGGVLTQIPIKEMEYGKEYYYNKYNVIENE